MTNLWWQLVSVMLGGVTAALITFAGVVYTQNRQANTAKSQTQVDAAGKAIEGLDRLADLRGEEIDRYASQVEQLRRDVATRDSEISMLRSQLQKLTEENIHLKSDYAEMQVRFTAAEARLAAALEQNTAQTIRIDEQSRELTRALARIGALETVYHTKPEVQEP